MNSQTRALLTGVNAGIIKIRGAYAAWCRQNGVNYHEMLILYSLYIDDIRTQKAISQAYGVPKQTINNLIRALQEKGYLTLAPNASNRQERILTLTESGLRYAESILLPLARAGGKRHLRHGRGSGAPDGGYGAALWRHFGESYAGGQLWESVASFFRNPILARRELAAFCCALRRR